MTRCRMATLDGRRAFPSTWLALAVGLILATTWSWGCEDCAPDSSSLPGPATPALHLDVLYPIGGLGDRSFADMVYEGVVRAGEEVEFTKTQGFPASAEEAASLFHSWTSSPASTKELIITVGFEFAAFVAAAKCAFGGRTVLHLDNSLPPCPALRSVTFRCFGPSFLAGVAAMQVSLRRRAAVIGGMDIPAVNEFARGFSAGVEHAGGSVLPVEYLSSSVDGFSSPDRAREVAARLYADADVIFALAGGSSSGIYEAARQAKDRYAVGADSDEFWMGRGIVIGSAVKRLDAAVLRGIREVAGDRFVAGHLDLTMANGGTELVINDVFAARVEAAVEAARPAALLAAAADQVENPW